MNESGSQVRFSGSTRAVKDQRIAHPHGAACAETGNDFLNRDPCQATFRGGNESSERAGSVHKTPGSKCFSHKELRALTPSGKDVSIVFEFDDAVKGIGKT
ncbi:MAG: hypothetical protein L0Y71_24905 [Gemmataceae bacterium]|nr:hypothetical protein [Gemmataceae bacterium]